MLFDLVETNLAGQCYSKLDVPADNFSRYSYLLFDNQVR